MDYIDLLCRVILLIGRSMVNKAAPLFCAILLLNTSCAYQHKPNMEKIEPLSESAIESLISTGIVARGMTKEQVIEAWGEPYKIKKVSSPYYDEIWFYKFNWKTDRRLYFKGNTYIDI